MPPMERKVCGDGEGLQRIMETQIFAILYVDDGEIGLDVNYYCVLWSTECAKHTRTVTRSDKISA
jgi:hypothetical protein